VSACVRACIYKCVHARACGFFKQFDQSASKIIALLKIYLCTLKHHKIKKAVFN